MKKLLTGLLAWMALLPAWAWAGASAWTSLPSPSQNGSKVIMTAIGKHPTNPMIRYAGTRNGFFLSADAGQSWVMHNSGIAPTPAGYFGVNDMAIASSGSLYITPNFLQKSVDGGNSWARTGWVTENPQALLLAVDPKTPNTVYAGSNQGVYKSIDGGVSWKYMAGNSPVYALAVDPGNPSVVFRAVASGIYRSTDGALSWSQVSTQLTSVTTIAVDPKNSANVFAGTLGSGVYKSRDGGLSWSPSNQCYPVRGFKISLDNASVGALLFDGGNPALMYLGALDGIYKSVDGGAHWTQANNGPMAGIKTMMLDPYDPNTVIAGNNYGLFAYTFPAAASDIDRILNWAEAVYSQYFYPAGAATQAIAGYQARYYSGSNTYIGSLGGKLYVYGAVFGGMLEVGSEADYLALAAAAGY